MPLRLGLIRWKKRELTCKAGLNTTDNYNLYYVILGIDPNTPDDQIEELAKKNYKKLTYITHAFH